MSEQPNNRSKQFLDEMLNTPGVQTILNTLVGVFARAMARIQGLVVFSAWVDRQGETYRVEVRPVDLITPPPNTVEAFLENHPERRDQLANARFN
jgi:hypothetical protein